MIPIEATTWSLEQTREAIVRLLPDGWQFKCGYVRGLHHVLFEVDGELMWEMYSPALNLALFDAYAYLATRRAPTPKGIWAPRVEQDQRPRGWAPSLTTEDPPDLDPAEIDLICVKHRGV